MQDKLKNHFAPRWVISIFMMSFLEAIGLAVYFDATLIDPEQASMQPLYIETQESSAEITVRSYSKPGTPSSQPAANWVGCTN